MLKYGKESVYGVVWEDIEVNKTLSKVFLFIILSPAATLLIVRISSSGEMSLRI
jgi:uncharacterized membrane protein YpjA